MVCLTSFIDTRLSTHLKHTHFISVSEANEWLKNREPVVVVQVGDDARAYPIQILIWHEIVNDTVGNEPLIVTFCPLCNTAIAFKRTFNSTVLNFGTTGRLRYSNLIMYDRQTETWWQQATGDAIAGEHTGAQLEFYPASMISWSDFKELHPNGKVLSRDRVIREIMAGIHISDMTTLIKPLSYTMARRQTNFPQWRVC